MKYRILSFAAIVGLLAQVALAPHAAVYASELRSPPPATVLSETAPASPLVDCPEDKAGDKPPDAASISPGTTVGTICPKGDVDFYRFNPPPGEKLAIALDDLPANFDLCLIFPDATETCSTQTGTNAETIKAEAKNGIHYLRVFGEMGAASALPYKLHLAV